MKPPPVCTGSGTIMVDFQPVVASLPSMGRCGICGQTVPLMYDCQTLAPHPYLVEEPSLDSPDFRPKELDDLAARDFKRVNR